MTRFLLQAAAFAALCTGSNAVRAKISMDKIGNSDAGSVRSSERPRLCDAEIVKKACRSLDLDNSNSETTISISELSHSMWATRASTVDLLQAIGIDAGKAPSGYRVDNGEQIQCKELCEKTVKAMDPARVPPTSDVGCLLASNGKRKCNIDLSPSFMHSVDFGDDAKGFEVDQPKEKDSDTALSITGHAVPINKDRVTLKVEDMQVKVANYFRIYPMVAVNVETRPGKSSLAQLSEKDDPEITEAQEIEEVKKRNIQAQAYIANAISKSKDDKEFMQKWMGETTQAARDEVRRVLNSVSSMMTHVVYKLDGEWCFKRARIIAYVWPKGARAKDGDNFVYFLCPLYFKRTENQQMGTLLHEGSHHATSFTHDVCPGEEETGCKSKAYGRPVCTKLAKEHPKRAQNNADSYKFYLHDLNGNTNAQ